MTSHHHTSHLRPRGLAAIAVLTAFSFGCTTLRVPVSTVVDPVPLRDGAADPQLELWLESAEPVSPEEGARASAAAHAAFQRALEGRQVGDGSQVLVVRAQGVARTASHRRDQTAAVVGLVVGSVVVLVGLAVWLSKGGGGGGGHGGAPALTAARPRSPGAAMAASHAVWAPRPLPTVLAGGLHPRPPGLRPPTSGRHPGGHGSGHVAVGIDARVVVPVELEPEPLDGPVVLSSQVFTEEPGQAAAPEASPGPAADAPPSGEAQGLAAASAEAAPLEAVWLAPLPPFDPSTRGFFDRDALLVELTLVDRVSGAPRRTKWVEARADPRDAKAVRALLDSALGEAEGWVEAP
ncbi:MAG: hypothetical protein IPO09_01840 [Anaeromyxobacter sp.]|nr:hypothetical protein [Anaeromyxobacter sp.]MBL0278099.1 hypothetical protein [Anaeromyxobacter sp.]